MKYLRSILVPLFVALMLNPAFCPRVIAQTAGNIVPEGSEILFLLGLMGINPYKTSEKAKEVIPDDKVFKLHEVQKMAEFPGGTTAMTKWIEDNISFPEDAAKEGVSGTVIVQCAIDATGKMWAMKIRRPVHPSLDAEAMRLANSMPAWQPAYYNSKPVAVEYYLPVKFKLK